MQDRTRVGSKARWLAGALSLLAFGWAPEARASGPTTADCLTASEQAVKAHVEHRLRAMRQQLLVCAAATCPTEIKADCAARVADVNRAIPTLVFEVRDEAGSELTGVSVTMDGEILAPRLEGIALSADPGEHKFVFTAEGRPPVEKTLVLHEGEKDRRERIVLPSAPKEAPPPPPVVVPVAPPPPLPVVLPPPPPPPSHPSRVLPLTVGGIGLAGIVVGAALGIDAFSQWSNAQAACSTTGCTDHGGALSDRSSAESAATGSTIAFIAGGALLATGVVLWFLPAKKSTTGMVLMPEVGSTGGGLTLRGGF